MEYPHLEKWDDIWIYLGYIWIINHLPSGKLTFCYGKIHHFVAGKIHYKSPCSIAILT